ncbi:hypothetical protein [Streptomyces sp. OK228]|uniref:hypothetical protein n=1 Tax=Streptomyces sp. OK228 TaxID=1882786 RepID=UPI000BC3D23B|nr:hypothetical protein [Streptomyces sp. OK228]SOE25642.1 hypothetical protein SAMN05442782_2385 [Streptomyces sp. OK228]
MPKYTVPLTGWANIAVTVETDETDPEKIAELATEAASPSLCHQCGDSRNDSLEIGDEWDAVRGEDSEPYMTKESN